MGNVCGAPAALGPETSERDGANARAPASASAPAHAQQEEISPHPSSARRDRAREWTTTLQTWGKSHPAMTRSELMRRREEFWGTRVEGRPEMWQAIRLSAESGDDSTARVILESAGLTPYDIDRADSCYCYDLKGFRYDIPLYCLYEPRTLVSDEKASTMQTTTPAPQLTPDELKRMDKTIAFKGRFSDSRVPDLPLSFIGRTPLSTVKEYVSQQTGIPTACQQLFYQGRKLGDTDTLVTAKIRTSMIIQFMIRPLRDADGNPIPIQLKGAAIDAPAPSTSPAPIKISSGDHSQSRSSSISSSSSSSSSSRSSHRHSQSLSAHHDRHPAPVSAPA